MFLLTVFEPLKGQFTWKQTFSHLLLVVYLHAHAPGLLQTYSTSFWLTHLQDIPYIFTAYFLIERKVSVFFGVQCQRQDLCEPKNGQNIFQHSQLVYLH